MSSLRHTSKLDKDLNEKGLFLAQKNFDIMAVFNSHSESYCSDNEDSMMDAESQPPYEEIIVDEFESIHSKDEDLKEEHKIEEPDSESGSEPSLAKEKLTHMLELPSASQGDTPNSHTFERVSQNSRRTNNSRRTFRSLISSKSGEWNPKILGGESIERPKEFEDTRYGNFKSSRNLFTGLKTEKRPGKPKDFMCTCKRPPIPEFYPFLEIPHHLRLYPDSANSQDLEESSLERSFSMPIPEPGMDQNQFDIPVLERQPLSNMINHSRPTWKDPCSKGCKHTCTCDQQNIDKGQQAIFSHIYNEENFKPTYNYSPTFNEDIS